MGAMIGTAILALNAVTRGNVDTNLRDRFVLGSEGIKDDPRGPKVALDTPLDSVEDSTWLFDASGNAGRSAPMPGGVCSRSSTTWAP